MPDATLMSAFQNTADDLSEDRAGRLTAAQRQRMQKATGGDSRSMAGFAIVFALIMGGVLAMIVNSGKVFHFSGDRGR